MEKEHDLSGPPLHWCVALERRLAYGTLINSQFM